MHKTIKDSIITQIRVIRDRTDITTSQKREMAEKLSILFII